MLMNDARRELTKKEKNTQSSEKREKMIGVQLQRAAYEVYLS